MKSEIRRSYLKKFLCILPRLMIMPLSFAHSLNEDGNSATETSLPVQFIRVIRLLMDGRR